MRQKLPPSPRWLLTLLLCCIAISANAADIKIEGYSPVGNYNGYPLYEISSSSISLSSTGGSFWGVYLDDSQIAYNSSTYWNSYSINVSEYLDGQHHKIQLDRGHYDCGICYIKLDPRCVKGGIYYIRSNEEAIVIGALPTVESVNILSEFEFEDTSYPVTSIGNSAFSGCSTLTSVTIPENVTSIGSSVFSDCSNLTSLTFNAENCSSCGSSNYPAFPSSIASLTIGEKVTKIPDYAFSGCSNLVSLTFNAENCSSCGSSNYPAFPSSIASLTIGEKVTKIPDYFLYNGSAFESVELPQSLTKIGSYAFRNGALSSITIPENVTSIGNSAFKDCGSLTEIHLSKGLSKIEINAFSNCPSLKTIYYAPKDYLVKFPYEFSSMYYNQNLVSYSAFDLNAYEEVSLIIIDSPNMAIKGCRDESLSQFSHIYYEENNQRYIPIIWNTPLEVSETVFMNEEGCLVPLSSYLKISTENNKMTTIFRGQDISADVLSNRGFELALSDRWGQNKITNYMAGEKARQINLATPGSLFDTLGLNNLQNIEVLTLTGDINGTDVMTINRMSSLKYLDIKDANIVEGGATYRENLKTSNNIVGSYFFHSADSLSVIILPKTLKQIKNNAFSKRARLETIIFGDSLISIGEEAFEGCISLSDISIPKNVNELAYNTFRKCSNLRFVVFEEAPDYLSLTSPYEGSSGFYEWDGMMFDESPLVEVIIGRELRYKNSTKTTSSDRYSGSTPFYRHKTLASAVIKGGNIPNRLFFECKNLQKVRFEGNSCKKIYREAFKGCSLLKDIDLPDSITSIGAEAFYGCEALESAKLPNALETITTSIFHGCSNLKELGLGERLKKINDTAFSGCSKIQEIRCLAPLPPEITSNVFLDVDKEECHLIVTKGNLVYYWLDPVWKEFVNMSDTILCLSPLPRVTYGDGPVDLSMYAPEGVALRYESSNPEVVKIEGSTLRIVGAGVATIGALSNETGEPMEIIGKLRQFYVDPADLLITVEDIFVKKGDSFPDFTYIARGLCYDDELNDITELPEVYCTATPDSAPGEYTIELRGGKASNYKISTLPATLHIYVETGVNELSSDTLKPSKAEIYNLQGRKVFEGDLENVQLEKGIYLIVEGNRTRKVIVP